MGRNIVICADGTGNAYARRPSNAARIVDLLAMAGEDRQVVAYDQGIGTDGASWRKLKDRTGTDRALGNLHVLCGPHESWFPPVRWLGLACGVVYGAGLRENVRQMYEWLAGQCPGESDHVYLFGFSRGAFTVRALAGLLHRCGLPPANHAAPDDFDAAWKLYDSIKLDAAKKAAFWENGRRRVCQIRFLGLWDTVKSYGGIRPVLLPHLRHNPIVQTVCHAMAMDEHRGWYDATSWGWLDHDQGIGAACACGTDYAAARLDDSTKATLAEQEINEVWFSGSHSDVGGGNGNDATSEIALTWMLAEAALAGVALNFTGRRRLQAHTGKEWPRPTDSSAWWSRLVDRVPRKAIDNGHDWPRLKACVPGPIDRAPHTLLRDGLVAVHASALTVPVGVAVKFVATRAEEALHAAIAACAGLPSSRRGSSR